jgi:outer membrane protein OmpA-like peptidoglycan-associated protein
MRYRTLVTALSIVLGGGIAYADQTQHQQQQDPSQQQGQTTETMPPASQQPSVNLFFDTASAELKPGADVELKKLADWARCHTQGAIILEGFADPRGSQQYNARLSAQRAGAVRQQLINMGVQSDKIVVVAFGENGPRKPTLAQERRVTVRAAYEGNITASL